MRTLVLILPMVLLAGCIVRATPYGTYGTYSSAPVVAESRGDIYYYGNHFIPENVGGGWCYVDGPHTHDYFPDRDDYYDYDQGYYWYRGPFEFSFLGGHPLPGGGWCFLGGPHRHDYFPPRGAEWRWNRTGYVYEGPYRPNRPPPASYWSRPAPRPDWRSHRPSVRPAPPPARRPDRPGAVIDRDRDRGGREPDRDRPGAVFGRDRDDREGRSGPGRSDQAPGHGGTLPPGQGGTPPGQQGRPDRFEPPGQDRRDDGARGRVEEPDRGRPAFTPPGRPDRDEDRGRPDRVEPRVEQPRGNVPPPATRVDEKAKKEKEKKDKEKEDDDKGDDRRMLPGRRR